VTALAGVALFAAFTFSTDAFAAKGGNGGSKPGGGDPPPELVFDGAACVDSDSEFPAMIYDVETVEGSRRKETRYYDIYLANSDGSCSVHIYRGPDSLRWGSYRQLGNHGIVVAARGNECAPHQIVGLNFDVVGNEVITPLPLEFELIWESPVCGSAYVGDPVLSPDGSEIFFSMEEPDPVVTWLDSLNVIDVAICTPPNCVADRLYSWNNRALFVTSINSTGSRLFLFGHDRVADTHAAAFVERNANGVWSSNVKDIATDSDGTYQLTEFDAGVPATAVWDYSATGTGREVVALGREDGGGPSTFDILDVQDCDIKKIRHFLLSGSRPHSNRELGWLCHALHDRWKRGWRT